MCFRYITLISIVVFVIGIILMNIKKTVLSGKILFTIGYSFIAVIATFVGMLSVAFSNVNANFYSTVIFVFAILLSILVFGFVWKFGRRKIIYIPLISAIVLCLMAILGFNIYQEYLDNIPILTDSDNLLVSYAPYYEKTKVAELSDESTLKINEYLPKMDGATALYPIYAAFAKAVYPKEAIDKIAYMDNGVLTQEGSKALQCNTMQHNN